MKTKIMVLIFASGLLFMFLLMASCTRKPVNPDSLALPQEYKVKLNSLEYDASADRFVLHWTPPATSVLGYNIYQAWNDSSDKNNFSVPRNDTIVLGWQTNTYTDPPGVGVGTYYYKVAALVQRANADGTVDTLEGEKSEALGYKIDVPPIGILLIDSGAAYTLDDTVDLTLAPLENFKSFEVLDSGGVQIVGAVNRVHNPIARVKLPKGSGAKTVYVRVTRADSTYILKNFIQIRPYTFRIIVRNSDLRTNSDIAQAFGGKVTTQKKIKFEIRTFGDNSFSDICSVWVATNATGYGTLIDTTVKPKSEWLETTPKLYPLDLNNDDKIYEYDLEDPENMKSFVYTGGGKKDINLKKRKAGAYWGGKDTSGYTLGKITDPKSLFYLKLNKTNEDHRFVKGVKEFYVVAMLKGKYFGDKRYGVSKVSKKTTYYWDFYPPAVFWNTKIKDTPVSGDTVSGPFNVRLAAGMSVWDKGRALPVEVELYFTRLTANNIKKKSELYDFNDIFKSRYILYKKDISVSEPYKVNVNWVNVIDPTKKGAEWPSGNYLMTIVTKDNLGNRGIAPSQRWVKEKENPRVFYIRTGK